MLKTAGCHAIIFVKNEIFLFLNKNEVFFLAILTQKTALTVAVRAVLLYSVFKKILHDFVGNG